MKHAHTLAALAVAAIPTLTLAQPAILSNQSAPHLVPISTGATTASGLAAPTGFTWSELQADAGSANAMGGLAAHAALGSGGFRLADDFTIPGTHAWRVEGISVYAYQSGAAGAPFVGANLRIWNGVPDSPGATVVFGDNLTNRLESVTTTQTYRVFSSATQPFPMPADTTKLIWELHLDTGSLSLQPGQYWLDWQIIPAAPTGEGFSPTVTKPATRSLAGANARQLTSTGWSAPVDAGKPATAPDVAVELPFVLFGYKGVGPCDADFNGDGATGLDDDIEAFFLCLGGSCCEGCGTADFNGDGASGLDDDIESFFLVLGGQPC